MVWGRLCLLLNFLKTNHWTRKHWACSVATAQKCSFTDDWQGSPKFVLSNRAGNRLSRSDSHCNSSWLSQMRATLLSQVTGSPTRLSKYPGECLKCKCLQWPTPLSLSSMDMQHWPLGQAHWTIHRLCVLCLLPFKFLKGIMFTLWV